MSNALRVKALCLSAILLGSVAFLATPTDAEPGAHWNVNGSAVTKLLLPKLTLVELEALASTGKKEGILLAKVGLTKVEIKCSGLKLTNVLLHESSRATWEMLFEGCATWLHGKTAPDCNPTTSGSTAGHITPNPLSTLLVLHELANGTHDTVIEVSPQEEGKPFVLFKFGEECQIGIHYEISGKAFLYGGENPISSNTITHLIQEGPLAGLFLKSGKNSFAMTLDGSVILKLAPGLHQDFTWGGTAS